MNMNNTNITVPLNAHGRLCTCGYVYKSSHDCYCAAKSRSVEMFDQCLARARHVVGGQVVNARAAAVLAVQRLHALRRVTLPNRRYFGRRQVRRRARRRGLSTPQALWLRPSVSWSGIALHVCLGQASHCTCVLVRHRIARVSWSGIALHVCLVPCVLSASLRGHMSTKQHGCGCSCMPTH